MRSCYALCEREDVGLTVMKGFAGGRLFDAARSPFGVALTPVQCIHYALTRPAVASILAGFSEVSTSPTRCATRRRPTTRRTMPACWPARLAMPISANARTAGIAPCAVGIDIATVNKFYDLAVMQDEVPASVREHYRALSVRADACVACRACETRCPFGVSIAERMGQAATLFA